MLIPSNSSSVILSVHLAGDGGEPITGQAFNAAGLAVSYRLESAGAYTALTLVDGTLGTYIASSWKEIGLGEYQLCLPNAAIVPGKETKLKIVAGGNSPLFDTIQARLPAGQGSGDRQVSFAVGSGDQAVAGARITVLSGSLVVASGITNSTGGLSLFLQDGAYTVRVATSATYDVLPSQNLTVSADMSVDYSLSSTAPPAPSDPELCTVRFLVRRESGFVTGVGVTARLEGENTTLDSTLVAKSVVSGQTNANGMVDLQLIKKSQFTRGGKYRIFVRTSPTDIVHDRLVTIPDVDSIYAEDLPDA